MTTQTVSSAVAKRETGADAVVRKSQGWFASIVPSHVDPSSFVALTVAYLHKNPKIAEAAERNPSSFMAAVSECARLGLVLGDTYHAVPFENRKTGLPEFTGMPDYTGEIELIYRAGAVGSVKAEIVRQRDRFRFTTDMDRPVHEPDWFGNRGDLIGAYAYAVMKDGATSKVIVYSKAEIDEVRAVSRNSDKPDSPWVKWYDRMALKTVLHRLAHFVPTSAEYRREQLRAAAEIAQQVNGPATVTAVSTSNGHQPDEVVDAEIVDEPQAPAAQDDNSRSPEESLPPAPPDTTAPHRGQAGKPALDKLTALFEQLELDEEEQATVVAWFAPGQWTASNAQCKQVSDGLKGFLTDAGGDIAQARSGLWAQHARLRGDTDA